MIKEKNKLTQKLIVISIIFIIIAASASASIPVEVNKKINDNNNFSEDTITQKNIDDALGFDLYNNFKKIVGNDSKIHFCGPAKILSIGKGLHLGYFFKLLILEFPFTLANPYPLSFPRKLWNQWIILADYFNDEKAYTIIEPLGKNETIILNGSHTVIGGIFKFSVPIYLRNNINMVLGILLNRTIDFPLYKYRGKMFWNWNVSRNIIFQYAVFYSSIMAWFILWPFKLKTQFVGFLKQLEWSGYTPFVIWTESSVINNIFKRN